MNGSGRFDTRVMAAVVMALGIITASWIAAGAARHFVDSRATITVTGSAKQTLRSDRVLWRGVYSAQSPQLAAAYTELEATRRTVLAYLATQGFADSAVTVSQVMTVPLNERMPNGMPTERIEAYRLVQTVELRSGDVARIGALARESTELLRQGVRFESNPPEFGVSHLADLKKQMLAAATQDARARAEEMAKNAGSQIGRLRGARMGVFQVTPAGSTDVSDYGVNDTSSLEKDITAVVAATFELR